RAARPVPARRLREGHARPRAREEALRQARGDETSRYATRDRARGALPVIRRRSALLLLTLLLPAAVSGQAADLRIEAGGPARTVPGVLSGGAAYPATAAIQALGGSVVPDARGASLFLFGDTIRVFTFSSVIHLRGQVHQLAYPVMSRNGELFLPEQFFIEWLPRTYPDRLAFAGGALRDKAALASGAQAPARPAEERTSQPPPTPPATTERQRQTAESTAASQAAQPAPPPEKPAQRIVIIDPGHGGRDPGKIGPNRLREKDVALAIAKRMDTLLRERGYEVHLTRRSDTLVALADRPRPANRRKDGRPSAIFI